MLKILGLDVNKWVVYIICIVLGTGILAGGYFIWKHNVQATAQLKFDNEQLKQVIAEQDEFIKQSKAIAESQDQFLKDLTAQNENLNANLKNLDDFLNAPLTIQQDRPSSAILKETIRQLKLLDQHK